MTDMAEAAAALTVLTRFIERRASETVVETAGDADINWTAT